MDDSLASHLLVDLRVACATVDRTLRLRRVIGTAGLIDMADIDPSLYDVAPELVSCEDEVAAVLAGTLPRFELPWVNRERDGRPTYVNLVLLPYRDEAHTIAGLLYLIQDVTPVGRLQQEITQQRNELRLLRDRLEDQNLLLTAVNAELRQLDEQCARFVSITAHELRAPLASMSGYIELLLDEDFAPLQPVQREFQDTLKRGTGRMLHIISNLLDVARLEAGRLDLVLQPTRLSEIVTAVSLELQPQLLARRQNLMVEAPADLPSVLCDPVRAAQIITNLVSNAIKYSPEDETITVTLGAGPDNGVVMLEVADHGIGIPLADQTNLFGRFFRAANVGETGATGAGLGLYITRMLVELHGGRVWCESQPGKGSTFFVTFLKS